MASDETGETQGDETTGDGDGDPAGGRAAESAGGERASEGSSSGAVAAASAPAAAPKPKHADMVRSLLLMLTQNIAQVAYLNAKLHSVNKIFFVGNFLRDNQISIRFLAHAIEFWSKGHMCAQFFRHEGYFGALGAFLCKTRWGMVE